MAGLADLYGTITGPSRNDIQVVPQQQQPGVIVGPSPRDIQFAQGPVTGPTRPSDIAFAVTPAHLQRAAVIRELMRRRMMHRYAVDVGAPQIDPRYSVDVGTPQIEQPQYSMSVGSPVIGGGGGAR